MKQTSQLQGYCYSDFSGVGVVVVWVFVRDGLTI